MHAASWPRVKWLRLSWSRKDFLTACGSVLVGTISLISSRLVSSCVVLVGPLGGRSGSSLGSLGCLLEASWAPLWALLGPPRRHLGPWSAPGPLLAALGPCLARSWGLLGPILAALGPLLGRSWPDLRPGFGASWASLGASRAALGSESSIFTKTPQNTVKMQSDLASRAPSWP